jgi:hypothetical protein
VANRNLDRSFRGGSLVGVGDGLGGMAGGSAHKMSPDGFSKRSAGVDGVVERTPMLRRPLVLALLTAVREGGRDREGGGRGGRQRESCDGRGAVRSKWVVMTLLSVSCLLSVLYMCLSTDKSCMTLLSVLRH